jgi:hypothetical protein
MISPRSKAWTVLIAVALTGLAGHAACDPLVRAKLDGLIRSFTEIPSLVLRLPSSTDRAVR